MGWVLAILTLAVAEFSRVRGSKRGRPVRGAQHIAMEQPEPSPSAAGGPSFIMEQPADMASSSAPSSGDAQPEAASASAPPPAAGKKKRGPAKFDPLSFPSPDQIMAEDAFNNCVVKTVVASGMGGLMGLAFGIFTASMDNSMVSAPSLRAHGRMGGRSRLEDVWPR
jgi:hypothetical protein